ncbi:DUF4142 domain-containing protein [Mucilaginibacter antarcticus]|uniref:DUF4142 domain-containing protein n=1 Tax=Mucilaginibacter antarcticus TaxID=1855725 RepID=A0ABW5XV31_9SPHI
MKKLAITLLAVVGLATSFTSCKKDDDAGMDMMQDQAFVIAASSSNMFEVAAANLALSKTKNTNVTAFANHMLTDHGQTATDMQILARQKQLDVAESMPQKYQERLITLTALVDTAFNRQYATMMVTSHQETINLFTAASQNSVKDEGIKAFAAGKLPTLKRHLEEAVTLKTQIGQ